MSKCNCDKKLVFLKGAYVPFSATCRKYIKNNCKIDKIKTELFLSNNEVLESSEIGAEVGVLSNTQNEIGYYNFYNDIGYDNDIFYIEKNKLKVNKELLLGFYKIKIRFFGKKYYAEKELDILVKNENSALIFIDQGSEVKVDSADASFSVTFENVTEAGEVTLLKFTEEELNENQSTYSLFTTAKTSGKTKISFNIPEIDPNNQPFVNVLRCFDVPNNSLRSLDTTVPTISIEDVTTNVESGKIEAEIDAGEGDENGNGLIGGNVLTITLTGINTSTVIEVNPDTWGNLPPPEFSNFITTVSGQNTTIIGSDGSVSPQALPPDCEGGKTVASFSWDDTRGLSWGQCDCWVESAITPSDIIAAIGVLGLAKASMRYLAKEVFREAADYARYSFSRKVVAMEVSDLLKNQSSTQKTINNILDQLKKFGRPNVLQDPSPEEATLTAEYIKQIGNLNSVQALLASTRRELSSLTGQANIAWKAFVQQTNIFVFYYGAYMKKLKLFFDFALQFDSFRVLKSCDPGQTLNPLTCECCTNCTGGRVFPNPMRDCDCECPQPGQVFVDGECKQTPGLIWACKGDDLGCEQCYNDMAPGSFTNPGGFPLCSTLGIPDTSRQGGTESECNILCGKKVKYWVCGSGGCYEMETIEIGGTVPINGYATIEECNPGCQP